LRIRKPITVFKDIFQWKKEPGPLPEDIAEVNEKYRELYKALGSLKDSYREVIILRKIKDLTIKETCEILNWSESKVKSTLHRAMLSLEKELIKERCLYEKTI
jgi:RNA polymerase sigma-70 factor (ECF subfamily)